MNLDVVLARRKRSLSALVAAVDSTLAKLSVLTSGKASCFSTFEYICRALQCQLAAPLEHVSDEPPGPKR